MLRIFYILFFLPVLLSCETDSPGKDIAALKMQLSEAVHDLSKMPIYADPATGDYEDLQKGKFLIQDSLLLSQISVYKSELEPFIVQRIDSTPSFIYLAAYLKYPSAVPAIKKALLRDDYFSYYGWEASFEPTTDSVEIINRQLQDHEYPYQMAAIAAVEYISAKSFAATVTLTPEEELALAKKAVECTPGNIDGTGYTTSCTARWLLCKFKGKSPLY